MTDALAQFLSRAGRTEWRWGSCDCFLFAADWVCAVSGRDPALAWRGKYHNARGARMIIMRAGGLEKLAGNALAELGWRRSEAPQRGDVGLVTAPIPGLRGKLKMGKLAAICLAPRLWAVKPSDRPGMAAADFAPLAVWTSHG